MVFCFHRIPTELQFECKAIIKKIFNQNFVSEFLNIEDTQLIFGTCYCMKQMNKKLQCNESTLMD